METHVGALMQNLRGTKKHAKTTGLKVEINKTTTQFNQNTSRI